MKKLRLTQKRREWLERLADNQVKNPDAYSQIPPVTALVQLETAGYLERNPTAKYPQWRITPAGLAAIASASSAAPEAAQVSRPLGDEPENDDEPDEPIPTKPLAIVEAALAFEVGDYVTMREEAKGGVTAEVLKQHGAIGHVVGTHDEKFGRVIDVDFWDNDCEYIVHYHIPPRLLNSVDIATMPGEDVMTEAEEREYKEVLAYRALEEVEKLRQENARLLKSEQAYYERVIALEKELEIRERDNGKLLSSLRPFHKAYAAAAEDALRIMDEMPLTFDEWADSYIGQHEAMRKELESAEATIRVMKKRADAMTEAGE